MVLVGDVPVQTGQDLVVALVGREVRPGTGIVAVLVLHKIGNPFKIGEFGAGNVIVSIGNAIGGTSPTVDHGRFFDHFTTYEEEELVLHDGAAKSDTVGSGAILGTGTGNLLTVYGVTLHVLILMIDVGRTLEGVGTGLGDGVHATADEVGLAHIVRGNHNLEFLDGVDGDGVAAAREVGGQTEVVVEVCTVNGKVGKAAVGTGEAHAVTAVRGKAGDIRDAAAHRGQGGNLGAANIGDGTRTLLGGELGGGIGHHHRSLEEFGGLGNLGVQAEGFSQLEGDSRVSGLLITEAGEVHLVGTAGTHTLDGITTVGVGNCAIDSTGGLVHGHHGSANDRLAVLVHHATGKGGRGHLSIGDSARNQRSECEQKAFESFFHKGFDKNKY